MKKLAVLVSMVVMFTGLYAQEQEKAQQEKIQQKLDDSQREINELKEHILKRVEERLQVEHEKIIEQVRQLLDKELAELYKKAQTAKAEEQGGVLGIGTAVLTKEIKAQIGYEGENGIAISTVFQNTPAARIGLMPGDVVCGLNDEAINDVEKFREALAKHKAGEFVTLKFWRQGNDLTIKVKLAPRPEPQQAQNQPQVHEPLQPQQQMPSKIKCAICGKEMTIEEAKKHSHPVQMKKIAGTGYLGVQLGELDDNKRTANKYNGEGVLIEKVQQNSPADEAGLEEGDIVEAVNQEYVSTLQELRSIIANKKAGDTITLTVWRKGKELDIEIALAPMMERPMPAQKQEQRMQPKNDGEGGYYGAALQERVDRFLQSLNENSKETNQTENAPTPKPYLGIQVAESKDGLNVVKVVDNSPAQKAGLAIDDVVKAINGVALENEEAMRFFMASAAPNSKVTLTVLRQEKEFTVEATLGARQ